MPHVDHVWSENQVLIKYCTAPGGVHYVGNSPTMAQTSLVLHTHTTSRSLSSALYLGPRVVRCLGVCHRCLIMYL